VTALWIALVVASIGSYGLKLAGVSLPESLLNRPRVQRIAGFLPVAMLSALVAIQLTGVNGLLHIDVKVAAVILVAVLSALRVPLIACVVAGALVAALLRAVFHL